MGLRAGEGITGKVYDEEAAYLVTSPESIAEQIAGLRPANREIVNRVLGSHAYLTGILATLLRAGDSKLGVLIVGTLNGSGTFIQADLAFIQILSDLIALAIDRARSDDEAAAARDAQQIERLRSEAMATLSHELRTPLSAIKGYATALLLEEVDWSKPKQNEFLQMIDDECENLELMISDILDSSLISMGQLVIEKQPVRLPRLVGEIVEEFQLRTEAHRLIIDFPSDFPIIDVDPHRIRQVVRNILDNAIKYSPVGGLIMIKGEIRDEDVVISIADQGVGISPEDLIPLFEMYFRVKAPTGYHVAGTGLGLPVSRSIIEAHNGRIWAESQVDQGTTIYFSLPLLEIEND
jgi:K+-sensing histidine kinase KdpD